MAAHDDAIRYAKGTGRAGASLHLTGTGNSIADAAAKANGRISTTVVNGQVSNLLDAASGLNIGKVLTLLAGGDKDIVIHCGGAVFDVKDGRGKSTLFVVDTEQTQVLGDGWFNLADERFDLTVAPKPKEASLLSLRTRDETTGPAAARFASASVATQTLPVLAYADPSPTGPAGALQPPPTMGIDEIRRILEVLGARYALIGAHAMAARGYPRST